MKQISHDNCDKQDITRLGYIQDFGVVVVVDDGCRIVSFSDNTDRFVWIKSIALGDLSGDLYLKDVLCVKASGIITSCIQKLQESGSKLSQMFTCTVSSGFDLYMTVSLESKGVYVVDIEQSDIDHETGSVLNIGNIVNRVTACTTPVESASAMCESLFYILGYDRGMVYRFNEDNTGEVVHEINHSSEASFMGLRFPATDIPLPARKAYIENPVRCIMEVHSKPCPMIGNKTQPISRSFLRGCASPHVYYLDSMGVRSSMSMAITVSGRLWGLLTFHSYQGVYRPTMDSRVSSRVLSSVISSHIQHLEDRIEDEKQKRLIDILSRSTNMETISMFIALNKKKLLDLFECDAIHMSYPGNDAICVGDERLGKDIPLHEGIRGIVRGNMNMPRRSYVSVLVFETTFVFIRVASIKDVHWAGNPGELHAPEKNERLARPRHSFRTYVQYAQENTVPFSEVEMRLFQAFSDGIRSYLQTLKTRQLQNMFNASKDYNELATIDAKKDQEMFAHMSHELRTPLHAIIGVLDIINNPGCSRETISEYSKIGIDVSSNMMSTLDGFLDVMKKTHESSVDISRVTIGGFMEAATSGIKVFANKNDVRLRLDTLSCSNKIVRLNTKKISRIINNTCGNGVKFSRGKEVDVSVGLYDDAEAVYSRWGSISSLYEASFMATKYSRESNKTNHSWLCIEVRDTGGGIRRSDISKIFSPFKQSTGGVSKEFQGTGLGLHICLRDTESMNGCMWVASTYGKGTSFMCAIPVEVMRSSLSDKENTKACQEDALYEPVYSFLVVDDSKINQMVCKKHIQMRFPNSRVLVAKDGKEAFEKVKDSYESGTEIDGVFMDYHMPVMSGTESSKMIREYELGTKRGSVPIVGLTADVTESARQDMYVSGIDHIITKPARSEAVIKLCLEMVQKNPK